MGDLISDLKQIRSESENGQVTQAGESLTVNVIRAEAASKETRSKLRGSRLGQVLAALVLVAVVALSVWIFRSRRLSSTPDLKSGQSAKSEAYEDYMRGMVNVNSENPADNQAAIKEFEQAIAADRNFAPAYAELSRAYTIKARYVASATERKQTYVDAEVAVGQALALVTGCGRNASARQQQTPNRAVWLVEGEPDLVQRLSRLPATPDLALLDRRKTKPFPWPHTTPPLTSSLISDGVASTY